MAKVTKAFLILTFLLVIGALFMAHLLYGQREMLRGRIARLEQAQLKFAQGLRYDALQLADLKQPDRMKTPLEQLVQFGDTTFVDLEDTKQKLGETRAELATTQDELATTTQELNTARNEIDVLEGTIAGKEREIEQSLAKIDELEAQKDQLVAQIDEMEEELASTKVTVADLNLKVQENENTINELISILHPEARPAEPVPNGLGGHILAVNDEWNFVIIDIGSQQKLALNTELMVHRGEDLLGKIRVSSIKDNIAIADIVRDWQRENFQEGDYVFYDVF